MAVNCSVCPTNRLGAAGVTAIDTNTGAVTLTLALADMLPCLAVMVGVPTLTPVTRPLEFTVADPELDDHVTEFVMFCVLLSV